MKTVIKILILLAFFAGGFLVGKRAFPCPPIERVDTLVVFKDSIVYEPKEVVKWRVRTDTVTLASVDTLYKTDSVRVEVPIVQKVYKDSLYTAYVSGYNPNLDSLKITNKYVYLTKYVKEKERHFGLGVSAGPTILYNGKVHAGLGVTAGVTYKF